MLQIEVLSQEKNKVGTVKLSESVFKTEIKKHLLHEVVVMQQANRRSGTASTKNRSKVRGGGAKPWKQKGTGRARAGTNNSPLWVGGGTVFGPTPRDYKYSIPKKIRQAALRSALSMKVKDNQLIVLDKLELKEAKTKEMVSILKNIANLEKSLIVVDEISNDLRRSARNIPSVKVISYKGLNVYDLLFYDMLILTKDGLAKVEEGLEK